MDAHTHAPNATVVEASAGLRIRRVARAVATHPNWASVIIWTDATVVGVAALVLGIWPSRWLGVAVACDGLCIVGLSCRIVFGRRLPRWTSHVDAATGIGLTTLALALAPDRQVDFAPLYVLVALYVAFFLSPIATAVYGCVAAAGYGTVLQFSPALTGRLNDWLSVIGVMAVTEIVVLGLTAQLKHLARHDPLTGLANRRAWDERVAVELARAQRADRPLSIAVVDLDDFKVVNDRGGHCAGDQLLIDVAGRWRDVIRGGGDLLARLGGDEFGVLAPDATEAQIRLLATRLLGAVAPLGVGASIGVATWDGRESASDLFRRGDRAMYQIKELRRDERVGRVPLGRTALRTPLQAAPTR